MATQSIFVTDPRIFGDFDAARGTALVGNLLRCEATRLAVPMQQVVISTRTSAKDGGIDAKVTGLTARGSLLQIGDSYFQIKTGHSFKPWLRKHLVKELFGKKDARPAKSRLGKEVRRCLDAKGQYILITLGHDLLPTQHSEVIEILAELFRTAGYKGARVDVIGQGQLASLIESYPSLCLELKGLGDSAFLTMHAWSQRADMKEAVQLGDVQVKFLEDVRAAWRGPLFQHIRIIGEPGVGKSRLLLEAASATDLAAATLYVPHSEDFQTSALFNELMKADREYTVHLIVDECEERERASIWSAIKGKPHIKLLTIDHGPETGSDSSMQVFQCPSLGTDQITAILAGYVGKRADLSNWSEWCEGSPRVAHAVGDNLKRNPRDILKPPATVPIWDRFVVGHQRLDSKGANEYFVVMRHLALFQRFGFEEPVSEEAQFISSEVRLADPNITWARFQEIVKHYKDRRILQGRHTLFIVPKALQVYLWVQFWDTHGRGFNFPEYMARMPEGLKHWFLRLFIYAHASPVAQSVVKRILNPTTGAFANGAFVRSDLGAQLLNYLAEADPLTTLSLLEATVGQWPLEEMQAWRLGRQDIVWALEKIAVWHELFTRAASILTRMALTETSDYSNNSKGTLVGLFGIGDGWAPTQAPPSARLPLVENLVNSAVPAEQVLGLELASEWLSTMGGSRTIGAEYQGLRSTLQFWRPKIYGDIFGAWRSMWEFLAGKFSRADPHEKRAISAVLIQSGLPLTHYTAVAAEIVDTLFEVADTEVDKGAFIAALIRDLRHPTSKYPKGVRARLKALDRKLTGTSFWDRFSRFVLFTTWDEDHVMKNADDIKPDLNMQRRVQKLALEAIHDPKFIDEYMPRFVAIDGHRLPEFGYELAKQSHDDRFDRAIMAAMLTAGDRANSGFMGGYLSAIRQSDADRWEALLLQLLEVPRLRVVAANSMLRSGISPTLVKRLLELYQDRAVTASAFSRLGFLAADNGIADTLIEEVVSALTERKDSDAAEVAIEIVDYYYCRRELTLPVPLIGDLITAAVELKPARGGMRDFYLQRILKRYRAQCPGEDLRLLEALLSNFRNVSRLRSQYDLSLVADDIVRKMPKEAWARIASAIESHPDQAFDVVMWLGDSNGTHGDIPGAMRLLDAADVIDWMRADPESRVKLIHHGLPRTLDRTQGGLVTQLFIQAFGSRVHVASALRSHFAYSGAWSGPRSNYLRGKRDEARRWLASPVSSEVEQWTRQYIEMLSEDIQAAEIGEERGLFG